MRENGSTTNHMEKECRNGKARLIRELFMKENFKMG